MRILNIILLVLPIPLQPSTVSNLSVKPDDVYRTRYFIMKNTAHNRNQILCFGDGEFVLKSFPLWCEGKFLIENEPKYQLVVHTTDTKYGCRKQTLAPADIIIIQSVSMLHPVLVTG